MRGNEHKKRARVFARRKGRRRRRKGRRRRRKGKRRRRKRRSTRTKSTRGEGREEEKGRKRIP